MANALARPRVLIADDMPEVRAFVVRLLKDEGYELVEASDGVAALDLIRQGRVDLALVDVLLPRMSGMTVLKEARQFTTRSSLPILLFTGLGSIEAAVEAMKLGANDYLTKPIPIDELLGAVRSAWREAQNALSRGNGAVAGTERAGARENGHSAPPEPSRTSPVCFQPGKGGSG